MSDDLFNSIGGEHTVTAAIEAFYRRVLEDETLHHFFASTDMAHLRKGQNMFVSMLLGGRVVYVGEDIGTVHEHARAKGLTDAHFDTFLQHFRIALNDVGVAPERAEKVMKLLQTKRKQVLNP